MPFPGDCRLIFTGLENSYCRSNTSSSSTPQVTCLEVQTRGPNSCTLLILDVQPGCNVTWSRHSNVARPAAPSATRCASRLRPAAARRPSSRLLWATSWRDGATTSRGRRRPSNTRATRSRPPARRTGRRAAAYDAICCPATRMSRSRRRRRSRRAIFSEEPRDAPTRPPRRTRGCS